MLSTTLLLLTLAIATLILFILLKLFSPPSSPAKSTRDHSIYINAYVFIEENSLDSRKKGKTILITGPINSGKTLLFQKLAGAPKLLQTVHSLKENVNQLGNWRLVDLPLDTQKLHSEPANFFHFNDLAGLILCLHSRDLESKEFELVVIMSFAVGILKRVPLCILASSHIEKDFVIDKLVNALNDIQNTRLTGLLSASDSSTQISFQDPINRLIFESEEGEVAADYQSQLRSYFDELVSIRINNTTDDAAEASDWIQKHL